MMGLLNGEKVDGDFMVIDFFYDEFFYDDLVMIGMIDMIID